MAQQPLLKVEDLVVEFDSTSGPVRAVDGVSFEVHEEEVFCIVGESGSGKSVTMLAVMGLLPENARIAGGSITFRGRDMASLTVSELNAIRGRDVAMVFQDPMTSLNPVRRVGWQIDEMLRIHRKDLSRTQRADRVHELLRSVGVADVEEKARAFPHQWSGGMRQRAMIAMAMAHSPALLVADEPTTALDVTVQAEIMKVLAEVRRENRTSMILITHDLGLVAQVADRIVVMYSGRVAEQGDVFDIFDRPSHPYTAGLLASVLGESSKADRAYAIPGNPPSPQNRPPGCAFSARCALAQGRDMCTGSVPVPVQLATGHSAACHFAHEATASNSALLAVSDGSVR
ncbi:ABC transporter ATP-binding protein [Demequina silvatica]|uniref:ABC transporter ATP-binding protein n=1 Tax=Demequina silvatica TaxID=1638988 RepID=UPI0007835CAB|nr:ABC transporter ATP-binding protein [Demequina silvatica]